MKLATSFLTLTLSLAAHAATGEDSPASPPPEKSELIAYGLAVAGTLAPIAVGAVLAENNNFWAGTGIITGGVFIGPSLGQFYAGSWGQGAIGAIARSVGGALIFVGLVQAFDCEYGGSAGENCSSDGSTAGISGLILFGGGGLYSLIDTHFAVQRYNERERAESGALHFDLFPALTRNADGSHRAGLMARVGF